MKTTLILRRGEMVEPNKRHGKTRSIAELGGGLAVSPPDLQAVRVVASSAPLLPCRAARPQPPDSWWHGSSSRPPDSARLTDHSIYFFSPAETFYPGSSESGRLRQVFRFPLPAPIPTN